MSRIMPTLTLTVPGDMDLVSRQFLQGMINRRIVGAAKYGTTNRFDCIKSLILRLETYEQTGNTENLMDAAVYAMLEFMNPKHENAHFKATDSKESPGYIGLDSSVRKL